MGFFLKGNKDLFGLLEFLANAKMRARRLERERERELHGKSYFFHQIEG